MSSATPRRLSRPVHKVRDDVVPCVDDLASFFRAGLGIWVDFFDSGLPRSFSGVRDYRLVACHYGFDFARSITSLAISSVSAAVWTNFFDQSFWLFVHFRFPFLPDISFIAASQARAHPAKNTVFSLWESSPCSCSYLRNASIGSFLFFISSSPSSA